MRWSRLAAIFGEAIELPPSERDAYLGRACADDAELRAEVGRLVALHVHSTAFLEPPSLDEERSGPPTAPRAGAMVGRYRIERPLATGGMGIVFEASQQSPSRRVALKMVHPTLVSHETLRRLAIESEALARLRHPGIAQMFEAGTHDFGDGPQPFIAMELIDGKPLLVHTASLVVRERVRLLAEIADAVQHAHEKGVVHRDLKPSNVLVERDGRPRILDFGVARLLDPALSVPSAHARTHTATGTIVGTIQYMSPEQLAGAAEDVDTRSDIYSLGVVAYETLSGRTPYDVGSTSLVGLVQAISSQALVPLGRVDRTLHGDLEWIVTKAMAPERGRRYASAQEFADDLRRFLDHVPISARPPTRLYQLTRFARRNRALVAGVATTIVALAVGMALYAHEARRARVAADVATREAAKSSAVGEFLSRLLGRVDPNRRSTTVDLRELVDGAAAEIDELFGDKPVEQAAVRNEVGTIYYNLGLNVEAEREYRRAFELREATLGPRHAETLDALNNLGQALAHQRRVDEALDAYERALEGRTDVLGASHPKTLNTMNNIATMVEGRGELDRAEAMLRMAVEARSASGAPPDEGALITMVNLAGVLRRRDKADEALQLQRRALDGFLALHGPDHRMTAVAQSGYGRMLQLLKRDDEAEEAFKAALAGFAASRGGHDPDTAVVAFRYGELLEDLQRHGEAAERFALSRSIEIDIRGPTGRNVLRMAEREANSRRLAGAPDRAIEVLAPTLAACAPTLSPDDTALLDALLTLARAHVALGDDAAAEPLLGQALDASPADGGKRREAIERELAGLRQRRESGG